MANEANIIPYRFQSGEQAREAGSRGGVASGAARRRKRSLREAAELYLAMEPTDNRVWNALSMAGIDPDDIDNQMAIIVALSQKAMTGDATTAKVLIELLGEDKKTVARNERLSADPSQDLCNLTDEQLKEMILQAEEDGDVQP